MSDTIAGRISRMIWFLAAAVFCILLAGLMSSCTAPREAVQIRADVMAMARTDAATATAEYEELIRVTVQEKLDDALADLEADYKAKMSLTSDPATAARLTMDYSIGLDKTKGNAVAESARLMQSVEKLKLSQRAYELAYSMADAEGQDLARIMQEFRESELPQLMTELLDQIEAQINAKVEEEKEDTADGDVGNPLPPEPVYIEATPTPTEENPNESN